jgi:hypothetical protein
MDILLGVRQNSLFIFSRRLPPATPTSPTSLTPPIAWKQTVTKSVIIKSGMTHCHSRLRRVRHCECSFRTATKSGMTLVMCLLQKASL